MILLALHRGHAVRGDREIRDRAIGLEADRAAERHEVLGGRQRLRTGTAVHHRGEGVGRIERSEHAHVVPVCDEALGERLDVPGHTPGVGP